MIWTGILLANFIINLLSALVEISDNEFEQLAQKWNHGLHKKSLSTKMFWKKAKQKLFKKR